MNRNYSITLFSTLKSNKLHGDNKKKVNEATQLDTASRKLIRQLKKKKKKKKKKEEDEVIFKNRHVIERKF
ncbi:hypothetical protein T4D_15066 [Trichinella pseudospiralis]|uniref:Uncharacterized protein n=1 Tax=Trichinella pseudospiralis TaxID=6337 RepID=A0A0V1FLG3_TRIPS|nr:hypothetical protein T4D_15066 [Trichinella pseudospiralis]